LAPRLDPLADPHPRLLGVGRRIPPRDRFAPDSPLEEAVTSELVSAGESLLIWENTGYLFQFGLIRAIQAAY
jgi:hypothetical protein